MRDIRNLNIWKKEEAKTPNLKGLRDVDISELNLGVRSFNCLKRANCSTVGDILDLMDEEGNGLRKIRNLGARSESEIKETIETIKEQYTRRTQPTSGPIRRLIKPMKITMNCKVDDFLLSPGALQCLHSSGIYIIQDLYRDDAVKEPGWFAVRELFEQILLQY